MGAEPTSPELELDLDVRLIDLWIEAWSAEEWDLQLVAAFLRLAYYVGYREALTEYQRGKLFHDHRQPVPVRGG